MPIAWFTSVDTKAWFTLRQYLIYTVLIPKPGSHFVSLVCSIAIFHFDRDNAHILETSRLTVQFVLVFSLLIEIKGRWLFELCFEVSTLLTSSVLVKMRKYKMTKKNFPFFIHSIYNFRILNLYCLVVLVGIVCIIECTSFGKRNQTLLDCILRHKCLARYL